MGSGCEVPCVFIVSSRLALPSRTCSIVPSRRLSRVHPASITSSLPSHALRRRRRRRRPWSTLACTQLCAHSEGANEKRTHPVLHGQSRRRHGSPETLHADVHGAGVIRRQRPVVTADGRVGDGRERERVGVARPPPTRPSDNRHLLKKNTVITTIAHMEIKINLPTQLCRFPSSSATPRLRTGWRAARGGRR